MLFCLIHYNFYFTFLWIFDIWSSQFYFVTLRYRDCNLYEHVRDITLFPVKYFWLQMHAASLLDIGAAVVFVMFRRAPTRHRATWSSWRCWKTPVLSLQTRIPATFHPCCLKYSTSSGWSGSTRSSTKPERGSLASSERCSSCLFIGRLFWNLLQTMWTIVACLHVMQRSIN